MSLTWCTLNSTIRSVRLDPDCLQVWSKFFQAVSIPDIKFWVVSLNSMIGLDHLALSWPIARPRVLHASHVAPPGQWTVPKRWGFVCFGRHGKANLQMVQRCAWKNLLVFIGLWQIQWMYVDVFICVYYTPNVSNFWMGSQHTTSSDRLVLWFSTLKYSQRCEMMWHENLSVQERSWISVGST